MRTLPPRSTYDWEAAFHQWVELGHTRSYQKVATILGTKKKTVMLAAHRLGWQERLDKIETAAREKSDAARIRDRAERVQDTIRIVDASRSKFASQLRHADFRLTGSDFVGLVKLEALLEGDATGRLSQCCPHCGVGIRPPTTLADHIELQHTE